MKTLQHCISKTSTYRFHNCSTVWNMQFKSSNYGYLCQKIIWFWSFFWSNNHHYRLSLFAFQNDFKRAMHCTEGIIYLCVNFFISQRRHRFLYPASCIMDYVITKDAVILLKGRWVVPKPCDVIMQSSLCNQGFCMIQPWIKMFFVPLARQDTRVTFVI